jgi:hypothetical protein
VIVVVSLSKGKAVVTFCFLFLFLFASFMYVQRASAATNPSPAFLISPSSVTVSVNDNFTVTVNLTNVQFMDCWEVILKFNGTGLRLNKMWIPGDNVFAGHTMDAPPPHTNYGTDAIDGSRSGVIGACTMGQDYVNVTNGILFSANFAALNAGQWSIQVADKSNPLHEPTRNTSPNQGSSGEDNTDWSFWMDTTDLNSHEALGSNCTVFAVNEAVTGPKIGTVTPLNSTSFLSLENFTVSSTSDISSLSFNPSISELSFKANVSAFEVMNITLPLSIVENNSLVVTVNEDGQSMPRWILGPATMWSVCPDLGLHSFTVDIGWIDPPSTVPEFSLPTILLLLAMLTLFAFALHQKRERPRTKLYFTKTNL